MWMRTTREVLLIRGTRRTVDIGAAWRQTCASGTFRRNYGLH
jgi:hypothetical protein